MPKKPKKQQNELPQSSKLPRIGIDCRLSGVRNAGIGRYVSNLVRELLPLSASEAKLVLFFYDEIQQQEVLGRDIPKNCEVVLVPVQHYSFAEQLYLPTIFRKSKLDLLHVPHFNAPLFYQGKYVVTIHDLLWHEHKGQEVTTLAPAVYWLKYWIYLLVVKRAIQNAKKIFVPSETVKSAVVSRFPSVLKKTAVTYEGVGDGLKDKVPNPKRKEKTLLYVGSLYPHKNVSRIFSAMADDKSYRLAIVTARTAFVERVKKEIRDLGIEDRVEFHFEISDSSLANIYQEASVLIQPSLAEGFGLTGIEAIALGTPVVASDIPIFREVYGNIAHYFNPHDSQSLLRAVERAEKSSVSSRDSKILLEKFSWKSLAKQTLDGYFEVLSSRTA